MAAVTTASGLLTTGHAGLNVSGFDALAAERGRFGTGRPGLHHLSSQVGSIEEVLGYEERLRVLGAGFLGRP